MYLNMKLRRPTKYPSNISFEDIYYREPKNSYMFQLLIKRLSVSAWLYNKV